MSNDLSKKLGQLFFVGFEGYTLTKDIKQFLKTVQPGGIILFENNIQNKNQLKKLIREINNLLEIKPFIGVDQEGGSVERLRKICTSVPSLWGLSKIGISDLLEIQKIIINELKELGINLNFSPVLDINSNPANPIIGTRSISNNPKIVAEFGSKIIELYLKSKIIPVAKHFPGHGDLNLDSHLCLPVLNKDLNELNNFEFIPFKAAIKSHIPLIMLAHIQLPKIEKDKRNPASLSKILINNVLKKELRFKGLTITDELNMKGIRKNFTLEEASYKAISSGIDLLLFNQSTKDTLKAFAKLKQNIEKDKLVQKHIEESFTKILRLKKKFTASKRHLSAPKNTRVVNQIADRVIHWIKKDLFFKPFHKSDKLNILYPKTHRLRKEDLEKILNELKIKRYLLIEYNLNISRETVLKQIRTLPKNTKKVLITYDICAWRGQKKLVEELLKTYPDLAVIASGLEYDIEITPKIKNYIAAYSTNYISLKKAFEKLLFA